MRSCWGGFAAVFIVLIACSSSNSDDADPAPKTAAEAFSKRYCQVYAANCCERNSSTFYSLRYCFDELNREHAKSTDVFFADTGDKCIAALEAAKTSATFCFDSGSTETTALCQRVFRPAGSPETAPPVEPSTTLAKEGEACDGSVSGTLILEPNDVPAHAALCPLSDGLYCDLTAKKCVKRHPPGEPCGSTIVGCNRDGFCDSKQGKCVPFLPLGATCSIGSTTERCSDSAVCDLTQVCLARVALGGACTSHAQCYEGDNPLCANGTCTRDAPKRAFCPTRGD